MVVGPIDTSQVRPPDDLRTLLRRDEATPIFNDVLGQLSKRRLNRITKGWPAKQTEATQADGDEQDNDKGKDVTADE